MAGEVHYAIESLDFNARVHGWNGVNGRDD
jgi:hypothetical protein